MPFFTVSRIRRLLNRNGISFDGARLLALGVTFKKDIDDVRNSAAVRVIEILRHEGAVVEFHDPYVPEIRLATSLYRRAGEFVTARAVPLDEDTLSSADCVVILVGHSAIDYGRVLSTARLIFDAVNATAGYASGPKLERL